MPLKKHTLKNHSLNWYNDNSKNMRSVSDAFFEKFSFFQKSQFGFRSNLGTIDAVYEVVRNTVNGFENSSFTTITLLDLSKAFDCVSRSLLSKKLEHYGIREIGLNLIKTYLNGRKHYVTINHTHSITREMVCLKTLFLGHFYLSFM